jgi:hypothetical protein
MIELGMTVWLKPFVLVDYLGRTIDKPIPGTVVYINEPHSFFTVEFKFPSGGHYRESFKFDEIEGAEK